MTDDFKVETKATVSEALWREDTEVYGVKAEKSVKISAHYPTYPDATISFVVERPDEFDKCFNVCPGDDFVLEHNFKVDVTHEMSKDQLFPVEITYAGQTYKLNKTKNNKLILTK